MLKCPYCRVEISTRTEFCPLCHAKLTDVGNTGADMKRTEVAYPKRGKLPFLSGNLFDKIYLLFWLTFTAVFVLTESLISGKPRICWVVSSLLIYLYLLLRVTLRGGSYFPQKITAHAILLSIVVSTFSGVISEPIVIFEFVLPAVYLASLLAISVFIAINYKHPDRYLLNIISIGLLSVLPFLIVMVTDRHANPIMSAVTLALGITAIAVTCIFKARHIINELKRKFHV